METNVALWILSKKKIILSILLLIIFFSYFPFPKNVQNHSEYDRARVIEMAERLPDVPQAILNLKSSIKTFDFFLDVNVKKKTIVTKVVEAKPLQGWKHVFVFLHGASSSSKIWVELESLKLVAALGHRAIAVDLPGWGGSGEKLTEVSNRQYLEALLKALNTTRPVIVTPSMSGSFSIPFMMEPSSETCHERLRGIISLAPVATGLFQHSQYFRCQIPAMIVYGSLDKKLGLQALGNLRNMPRKRMYVQKDAGHPSYIDKPAEWNNLLYHYCTIVVNM